MENNKSLANNLLESNKFERYTMSFKTYEYEVFKRVLGNRDTEECHSMKLANMLTKKQYEIPILVNENLEVIDGEHRLMAIRWLAEHMDIKLPVYFNVQCGTTGEDAMILNLVGSRNWKLKDYVVSEVLKGNKECELFMTMLKKYNLGLPTNMVHVIAFVKGVVPSKITKQIKDKTLRIADSCATLVNVLEEISLFNNFSGYTSTKFLKAVLMLMKCDKYNHSQMISKWNRLGTEFKKQKNDIEYLNALVDVYNDSVKPASKKENQLSVQQNKKSIAVVG